MWEEASIHALGLNNFFFLLCFIYAMSVLPECIYTTCVQCHQRPEEVVKTAVIVTGVNTVCAAVGGWDKCGSSASERF